MYWLLQYFGLDSILLAEYAQNTGLAGENYLYFVSVDKDFPVLDRIKQEKLVYDKFEPWLVPVMAGSVLVLILALAEL